jgi:hypothetical protein
MSSRDRNTGRKGYMDYRLIPLYFVVGGTVVTVVTYLGSQGKGLLAAFVSFFPAVSVISLCAIYMRSGTEPTLSYAKGILFLLPAWILYIVTVIYLLPRWGLIPPLIIGILLYTAASYLTSKVV